MAECKNILLDLPVSVGSLILANWLDTTDVARLDCGLLSKRVRPSFLTLLSSTVLPNANSKNVQLKTLDGFTEWLNVRSVRVEAASLHGVPAAIAEKFLELSGCVLTYLSVVTIDANFLRMSEVGSLSNANSVPLTSVARHCSHLQHLVYDGNVLDGQDLQDVLRANPCMSKLDLIGSLRRKRKANFKNVVCPQLTTVTARLELKEEFEAFLLPLLLSLLRPNQQVRSLVLNVQFPMVIRDMICIENADVLEVLTHCPCLTALSLQGSQVDSHAVRAITTLCPQLQHVDFSCVETVDDLAVQHLAQHLQLRSLYVDSTNVSHQFLTHLSQFSVATLRTLSCTSVNRFGQTVAFQGALKELLSSCNSLRALVADSAHLTEEFDLNLAKLSIFGSCINNSTFQFVSDRCESLKTLCVVDFKPDTSVDEDSIQRLVESCFNLHTIVAMGALYERVSSVVDRLYRHRLPRITVSSCLEDMQTRVLNDAE